MRPMSYFIRVQPYLPMLQQASGNDDDSATDLVGVGAAYHAKLVCEGPDFFTPAGTPTIEHDLQASEEELRALSAQLLAVQELERKRIAADLHDGLGQSLSLIRLSADTVSQLIKAGAYEQAVAALRDVGSKVRDAIAELHRTTMDMRPSMLDDLGVLPTLSWFFRDFELAWKDKRLDREVTISESDVPVTVKVAIFRILQEAMNNIVKHANADRIKVGLKVADDSIMLSVEDNGDGFNPATLSMRGEHCSGFGLLTMRERARSSGGVFELATSPGRGTRILVVWAIADLAGDGSAQRLAVPDR